MSIRRQNVNIREAVGAVEEFSGEAEIRDGLPDEEGFLDVFVEGFAGAEDGGYEVDAAGWRAD
tara:strand:- start:299 stop:487 length:189 start_codon:yes stop_codon:yes gene_type:complete